MRPARALICRPTYYDVTYQINPWMDLSRTPAIKQAQSQWEALHQLFFNLGLGLEYVDPIPNQPDMVFTANAGLVQGKTAVLAKFRFSERQGEEVGFKRWFEHHGYSVVEPTSGSFEGEGDALFSTPDTLFLGFGFRTDKIICDEIPKLISVKNLIPCELTDPRFYHLDTCFTPITKSKALFFPGGFTKDSIKRMEQAIELIAVPEDDALKFACNSVVNLDQVIIPAGCKATEEILNKLGFTCHSVELNEFLKAGGAAKCLTLWLDNPLLM